MDNLAKMLALVATKFKNKQDRQGKPYFLHCIHVMQTCGLEDENSLCCIVKDENEYIDEWVNHHKIIGFDLYNI